LCCHHCGSQSRVPELCPSCGADALEGFGYGTQQLESLLEEMFAPVPVLRFDIDQAGRKGVLDEQIDQVKSGDPCLLVGTQMLAKGHHFPGVTLVIVVGVDQALYSADYRALERMGQLLEQVAGRAGRADKPGTVMLQTLHPEHEALERLTRDGYAGYAQWLLDDREASNLPPFSQMALLRAEAQAKPDVAAFLEAARGCFPRGNATVMGPLPAMMERRGGRIRMYLAINAQDRSTLHRQIDAWLPRVRELPDARKVRWAMDIDPLEL
jgi:primosomal protein N' (replication factor Y)